MEDTPIILEDLFLPEKTFRNFDKGDFNNEIMYPIYAEKYHVPITNCDDFFEPRIANQQMAKDLGIEKGDPVIFIERIAYTHKMKPVEFRSCIGRGDMFRCHLTMGNQSK
jgi:GntR family transcriptional regulator